MLIQLILIAISLSMDAFSLAMVYGTLSLDRKMIYFLSLLVGCFHFFMPILGSIIGIFIDTTFFIDSDKLVGIIFLILGLEMLFNIKELDQKEISIKNMTQAFLFALGVSIDSFSVGIGLGVKNQNIILCGLIFAVFSATFTKQGLSLGKKLSLKFGKIANIIGSVFLIYLGIHYFL